MLIPEHKFLVEQVGAIESSRDGKHKFQKIILTNLVTPMSLAKRKVLTIC